jgi:hypothetical protein
MEYENSSHYANSRTALWCPVCGAAEGRGCTEVKGLRFSSHNSFAVSTHVLTPSYWEPAPVRKDAPRPKWTPNRWVN